jgi:hypothetical protein
MCRSCEGSSQEELLAENAEIIAEHGYLVTGVGDGDPPHWTYTVGLLDLVGHPELVVAGPHFEVAGALINRVGREILGGRSFAPGDVLALPDEGGTVRFGRVHSIQHRLGTFNMWHALADRGDVRATKLEVVQVFAPRTAICRCELCRQPDLSRPESRVGVAPLPPRGRARRGR